MRSSLAGCRLHEALEHLDFRYPDEGWRDMRPGLAQWYARFAERDSMRSTAPE